ncbi:hypothetical protein B0H14DRAFT_3149743 [Mycena olivaceomarginata]|nr:hypothetical protein B0H14DRAFT_3149743 [Mycena olivaceomarginata]
MFSKISVVVASVLVHTHCTTRILAKQLIPLIQTLAAAIPNGTPPPPVTTPDSPQCCASVVPANSAAASAVVPANSAAASAVAALVGLDLTGLLVDVGLSCSPITVVGNNCGNTTVTCDAPEKEWGFLVPPVGVVSTLNVVNITPLLGLLLLSFTLRSYEDAQTAAPLVFTLGGRFLVLQGSCKIMRLSELLLDSVLRKLNFDSTSIRILTSL